MTLTVSRGAEQNTEFPDHGRMPGSADRSGGGGFRVHLENFDGPFDLLLQLLSRHKLDITEVSLSQVTDEFIAHIKAAGTAWDLDQTSQFVVVAATLLDLKAARHIPSGEVEDPEDLALLESRGSCSIARSSVWPSISPPLSRRRGADFLAKSG